MKVTVLKGFKDKHTGEEIRAGRILDIPEERVKEITENLGAGAILAPDLDIEKPAEVAPAEGKPAEKVKKSRTSRKKVSEEG